VARDGGLSIQTHQFPQRQFRQPSAVWGGSLAEDDASANRSFATNYPFYCIRNDGEVLRSPSDRLKVGSRDLRFDRLKSLELSVRQITGWRVLLSW
jgi:hypothetical protein